MRDSGPKRESWNFAVSTSGRTASAQFLHGRLGIRLFNYRNAGVCEQLVKRMDFTLQWGLGGRMNALGIRPRNQVAVLWRMCRRPMSAT
jgi:hypothetical protein